MSSAKSSPGFLGKVGRGSAAGVALHLLHAGTRFVLVPIVVASVGLEAYGFWALLFQALGLIGLHRIGLPVAAVSFVARLFGSDADDKTRRITHLLQNVSAATLVLVVPVVLTCFLASPTLIALAGMDAWAAEATRTLRITAVATGIALVLGGYQSALEGLQRHPRVRAVEALTSLLEVGLILALLRHGFGLDGLAIAYAVRVLLPLPVYAWLAHRELPGISALPLRLKPRELFGVLRFGGSLQLFGFLHLLIASIDRVVLAHGVSLFAAGAFELARKLIQMTSALPQQACAPLTAAFAHGSASERSKERLRWSQRLLAVAAAPLFGVLWLAPEPLLALWLDEPPVETARMLQLLAVGGFFHTCTAPLTSYLRGQANGGFELRAMLLWAGLVAVLAPTGCLVQGALGAVAGSVIAQGLTALWMFWRSTPITGVTLGKTLWDVLLPLLCCLPFGLWLSSNTPHPDRWTAFQVLFTRGLGYAVGSWALWFWCGTSRREKRALFARLHLLLFRHAHVRP